MKRFLGLIIAAIMVFMQAMPAFAVMDKSELAVGDTIWFASGYGGVSKWRIVEKDTTPPENNIVMISTDIDNRIREKIFSRVGNEWASSEMRRYLNSSEMLGSGAGFLKVFTNIENASLISLEGGVDRVMLPTLEQVKDGGTWGLSANDRKMRLNWWLRDKATFHRNLIGVDTTGNINPSGYLVSNANCVVPVIRIKLDDVVFALPISDITDTGSMILSKVQTKAGDKKLVYRDNVGQSIAKATQSNAPMDELAPNQELDINYKDALVNTSNAVLTFGKTVVSSIISDKTTGNMLYYGVLGEFTNANPYDPASGTVKMKLPADFDKDNHEIMIYAEAIHTPSTHDGTNRAQNFTNYISDGVPLTYVASTPPLPTQHTLTVDGNGSVGSSGTGTYAENVSVPIYAGTKAGFDFDGWTYTTTPSSISLNVADITADRTTVTMPVGDVMMTAGWKASLPPIDPPDPPDPPDPDEPTIPQIYNLVVEGNGSINSTGTGDYIESDTVHIYAGVREGYTFSHWTVSSASKVDVVDTKLERITITMPANRVVMTANWIANSTGGDITITNEPDTIPPMPQEPFAVEPPNAETSDMSSTGIAIGILFVSGMTCGILGGMSCKKYKQNKAE